MSPPPKPKSKLGFDAITDRFRESVSCDSKKDDSKEANLGSPNSPLKSRQEAPSGMTTTTTTTSSSSSSGSASGRNDPHIPASNNCNKNSGVRLGKSAETSPSGKSAKEFKPGHTRSVSCGNSPPVIKPVGGVSRGGSSASSPVQKPILLPTGNICPSGKVIKTGMASRSSPRSDVLGSGTANYGHGSIMRGTCSGDTSPTTKPLSTKSDEAEVVKKQGNDQFRRGNFAEALSLYDRAISLTPRNAPLRSNRAAALTGLGRLVDAVRECEEAVKLDPRYARAQHRLASLYIRLGQIENARLHICEAGTPEQVSADLQKLENVDMHINQCCEARRIGDWRTAMREADTAIAVGADSSPQLFACRAEALLKLDQLDDAMSTLKEIPEFQPCEFSGMNSESYVFFVRSQIDLALGRFDEAAVNAESAWNADPQNSEVSLLLKNVKLVVRARHRGNYLFESDRLTEACSAYEEGLKICPSNSILYCNRAACWYKLSRWEQAIEDCTQALRFRPTYSKALLTRATSNSKLGRWSDAVNDYQGLRRLLPDDRDVAEQLFHAQVSLKKSRGEGVSNMKFGGEVEQVLGMEQFKVAVSLPGVSVFYFGDASDLQCERISPFVDSLCKKNPSVNFLKVDAIKFPDISNSEKLRALPTFKIYKDGTCVKEMICPNAVMLENTVRHYSLG